MKTDDLKDFINSLNSQERSEYQLDIAELKERIRERVGLKQKRPLKKYPFNNN